MTLVEDRFREVEVALPEVGQVVVVDVDGVDVAVARLEDGVHAFDDACTHRGCPLSEGVISDGSVTCPCHRARFDLVSGRPLDGPATEPIRIRRAAVRDGVVAVEA